MTKSMFSNPFSKETTEDKNWRWWSLGVALIGFFFLFVFEPPPDYIIFQCDRGTDLCAIQKSGFFRTEIIKIKVSEIKYAQFDPAGWMTRGDHGLDIKLQSGNHIWIGTGSTFFGRSKEQRKVDEINNFLTNTELKQVLVTDKSFPTVLFEAIFLLGGLYSIYKGLRPYVLQGLNKND
jgi:hypothetical protein